ncbi:MAG: preprotein translocase subunit YajC [Alicyclobacillus macrosporangiidus]|uniref:preprotein translocase subunit YajC n=1 Tax=Alicyclobacillus macrosporangiidus TaxID=392015 RepID=UPI0026ECBBE6|nr:preprotein translocase subunit YajC [Alicyclobacillus macrosporangiidus]MCL6597663.1 preprotein translocase subunit YajC [Alicyclobacillus macrosporangiidus]
MTQNIILLVVMLVVFYALLILPQRRQQKQRQNMMKQLGPGAKILTTAGIFGRVVQVNDDVLVVNIADGVDIQLDSRAVLRVVEPAPQADPA